MTWESVTKPMRMALKAAGIPSRKVSIRGTGNASLTVVIKDKAIELLALRTVARVWYSAAHSWLYIWVYDESGKVLLSGLSDGFIPERYKK